jgi:hypothetical protein
MQQHIGLIGVLQPHVELREGMGRREALLEQKAHRVALVAEGRLHADEDIAEMLAQHEDAAPVRLDLARRGAPDAFDHLQRRREAHDGVGIHMGRDIRLLPVLLGVAVQHRVAQIVDGGGNLHVVALGLHAFSVLNRLSKTLR